MTLLLVGNTKNGQLNRARYNTPFNENSLPDEEFSNLCKNNFISPVVILLTKDIYDNLYYQLEEYFKGKWNTTQGVGYYSNNLIQFNEKDGILRNIELLNNNKFKFYHTKLVFQKFQIYIILLL